MHRRESNPSRLRAILLAIPTLYIERYIYICRCILYTLYIHRAAVAKTPRASEHEERRGAARRCQRVGVTRAKTRSTHTARKLGNTASPKASAAASRVHSVHSSGPARSLGRAVYVCYTIHTYIVHHFRYNTTSTYRYTLLIRYDATLRYV